MSFPADRSDETRKKESISGDQRDTPPESRRFIKKHLPRLIIAPDTGF